MHYSNDGLFITCDSIGKINSVKYFKGGFNDIDIKGKMFVELFVPEYISLALNFLTEIKKRTASFGWELVLKSEISNFSTHFFSGIINEGEMFIFASPFRVDFKRFLEAMAQINSEQTNAIRSINKEQQDVIDAAVKNDHLFNELSRVNNELINTQREIAKKNRELQESMKINNYLLGMAAHDLRNPLGNIFNYCEFLEETACENEQVEFIKEIKHLSNFMLGLVSDLLSVSAIESGNIALKIEQFDIDLFLTQIILRQRLIADRKKIVIEFDSKGLILVNADKIKIEQVFTNLISNGIKFSNPNTVILVSITETENSVVVKVKDQGQGIKENELNLLFKPFQKTSSKSTAGEPSTGLGLFIVKRIIEAGKGKIWVESEVNKGTTFFVELMK